MTTYKIDINTKKNQKNSITSRLDVDDWRWTHAGMNGYHFNIPVIFVVCFYFYRCIFSFNFHLVSAY